MSWLVAPIPLPGRKDLIQVGIAIIAVTATATLIVYFFWWKNYRQSEATKRHREPLLQAQLGQRNYIELVDPARPIFAGTIRDALFGLLITEAVLIFLYVLWHLLSAYIQPGEDPTQKKDLVQAYAVIVGGLVAFGTLVIGWRNLRNNQKTLQVNQRNTEQTLLSTIQLEVQRAQDAALGAYFEQVGELLLDKNLRNSSDGDEVRMLARAQTHTVLKNLNEIRKGSVVQFLYEANLIRTSEPIINLSGADLRQTALTRMQLSRADLGGADLRGADLSRASLNEASLRKADLSGVHLYEADLSGADLRQSKGLRQYDVRQAIGDKNTKLPEDLTPLASWVNDTKESG